MTAVWKDLRIAARVVRNSPGFAAVAVLTLGLGIAANTTVFGWIDTVLMRPIPGVSHLEELTSLEGVSPEGGRLGSFPHPDFRDYQRELTLASGVVATHMTFFSIGPIERPRRVLGQVVSANFFAVLGVQPYLGRMFLSQEDRDDPGGYPIAVISHRLWRSYFRGDAEVVGKVVRVNGRQLTLAGVAPPDFRGTWVGAACDVWVPLSMIIQMGSLNTWAATDRNARFLEILVRRKPGVTIGQLRGEAQSVAVRIAAAYPDTHRGIGASAVPLWRALSGAQTLLLNPLRLLMGVCVLVLLIACANVASLLVARSVTRQREFGVRMALGAGRARLARQLLAEVLVLAGGGALVGVVASQWFGTSLSLLMPPSDALVQSAIEPLMRIEPNRGVLAFAVLISMAAAVLATLLPAHAVGRLDVNETLKQGGRSGTAGARSNRARAALVVAEVALAAMALIGAGLAVRSFQKLAAIRPGFDPRKVLLAHFHLSTNGYSLSQEKQFSRDLRLRLEAAPGIEQAGYADSAPLSLFPPGDERVQVEGSAPDRSGVTSVARSIVAPGYFRLMRIPLLAGRDFSEQDDRRTPPVIIVNESFVRRYFEGRDPIGRKVRISGVVSTVVGLVQDGKYRSLAEGPTPFFYGPFRQIFFSGNNNFFYVRTTGDLEAARVALRREVAALGGSNALYDTSSFAEQTEWNLFGEKIAASLLSVLGIISLALAAVGLYSVMSYVVSERTQEIGIRMALGAQRHEVVTAVLRKGLALTVAGLAAGVAALLAGVRVLSSVVAAPVSIAEPVVFAAAALFLVAVALLASYLPARRATKIDPMAALRSE
jgi:predicted permease